MNSTPDRPETLAQARNWDKRCRAFQHRGCCPTCSAQAAYAHQDAIGFARVNPPCQACAPIVAAFPLSTVNPHWRTVRESSRKAPAIPLKTDLGGTTVAPRVRAYPRSSVSSERAA